jgi:hypothetical protein
MRTPRQRRRSPLPVNPPADALAVIQTHTEQIARGVDILINVVAILQRHALELQDALAQLKTASRRPAPGGPARLPGRA